MGTQKTPDSKSKDAESVISAQPLDVEVKRIEDTPRIGPWMRFMLACMLIPPAAVTLLGNFTGSLPNQTLWVILLGCPIFILLLSLPRRYVLEKSKLIISGFFYKIEIPYEEIEAIRPIRPLRALIHSGSIFSSDPGRALEVVRRGKRTLLISPYKQEEFLKITETETAEPNSKSKG